MVLAMSAWSVKTRRAPSRHCRNAKVYGHTATAMHDNEYRIGRFTHYHTPQGRFSMVNISRVGVVSVPKWSTLETSRGELSEDVSFRVGTLLVVEQLGLDNRRRGV